MGMAPLTWLDVKAYSDITGSNLTAWEADNVITMSRQYCVWHRKGEEQGCPSPWTDGYNIVEASAPAVCAGFKALAKKARNNKKKRA